MPFPTSGKPKLYEITVLSRKGNDHAYQLWLDNIDDYVARVQRMLRESDWAKDRYYGVKVSRLK